MCPKCQILKEGRKNDIFFLFFLQIISIFIADMVKWLWLLKGENSLDEKDKRLYVVLDLLLILGEKFKGLVEAGMNVARINFSHAVLEERETVENLVKRANEELGANIGVLYDTKGPDLRTCEFENDKIDLVAGNTIRIVEEDVIGNQRTHLFKLQGSFKRIKSRICYFIR